MGLDKVVVTFLGGGERLDAILEVEEDEEEDELTVD